MSSIWIDCLQTLWPAIIAALTVSLAWHALETIGWDLPWMARSRTITIRLRVTVRPPRWRRG